MVWYVVTFLGGAATGISLLLLHQYSVRRAVSIEQAKARRDADRLRAENRQLREDVNAYEMSSAAAAARAQGKITGIREGRNMSNYERLESTLNPDGRRNVKVGAQQ